MEGCEVTHAQGKWEVAVMTLQVFFLEDRIGGKIGFINKIYRAK